MKPSSKRKCSSENRKKSSTLSRPAITLKLATSLDGKIALANGESEWITCEEARLAGRRLRARHDAIAIGSNTAVLDNPQLTARITGERDPIRVIFDGRLRLRPESNLAKTAQDTPVWVFTRSSEGDSAAKLLGQGVRLFPVSSNIGLDISEALDVLTRNDIRSLLIEGGGQLAASFIQLGVIDVIEWFRAPVILGGDGRDGIGNLGLQSLNDCHRFNRVSVKEVGTDLHETYQRAD